MEEKETERKYVPFSVEDAEKLAKDGERATLKGFVKTEGFDKTVVFMASIMQQIWEVSQRSKSFRMELFYDAEALNTYYVFFHP